MSLVFKGKSNEIHPFGWHDYSAVLFALVICCFEVMFSDGITVIAFGVL